MKFLSDFLNKQVFLNFLGGVGVYGLGKTLVQKILDYIQEKRLQNQQLVINGEFLQQKYGKGSYVIITGSTRISGLALSQEFAELGFNLILIDQDQNDLQVQKQDLQRAYPQLKIVVIQYDFNFPSNFDDIFEQIEDLDVSILVNNSDLKYLSTLSHSTDKEVDDLITHNIFSKVFMTKQFIKSIEQNPREFKSSIINLVSNSLFINHPYLTAFSGSQRFGLIFSEALRNEVDPKQIEIFTFVTGFLKNDSIKNLVQDSSCLKFVDSKEFAKNVISSIHKTQNQFQFAHWKHQQEVWNVTKKFQTSWTLGAYSLLSKISKLYFLQEQQKRNGFKIKF